MSSGFLKLNRSKETEWLLSRYPIAYLLLNLVALRAVRTNDHSLGLKLGEAFIGDHEAIGVTRQQYRTALKFLIDNKFLEKIETCRSRKKKSTATTESTTESTTVGTKVKLLDSKIWDINFEQSNHRINHRINHEQEIYKNNNSIVVVPPKNGRHEKTKERHAMEKEEQQMLSSSKLYEYAIRTRKDWKTEEIEKAYERYKKNWKTIVYPFEWIEGVINKKRVLEINFKKKEKTTCVSNSKKQSEKDNSFYAENDTWVSPLAKYAPQNGLNIKSRNL